MIHPELIATRRAVSLGKLILFQCECERLADLVIAGTLVVSDAADTLAEAAEANDLYDTFGVEYIQETISMAFESAMEQSVQVEPIDGGIEPRSAPPLRLIRGGAA